MITPFTAVEARAPGKIILAGEHAVVYGRPALAVPVFGVRARVQVRPTTGSMWLSAPAVNVDAPVAALAPDHPLRRTVELARHVLGPWPAAAIRILSDIPVAAGLGSGAAVTVALLRALAGFTGRALPDAQVNALAYEIEKLHHGTPSGIDNTVITYARPILYRKDAGWQPLHVGGPVPLVIADSGRAASTRTMVAEVRARRDAAPARYEALFDAIAQVVRLAQASLAAGDLLRLGQALSRNHELLQNLGVSTPELDALVGVALAAGAFGAKLAGAGGGGNIIAVTAAEAQKRVAQALRAAGAARVILTVIPPTEAS